VYQRKYSRFRCGGNEILEDTYGYTSIYAPSLPIEAMATLILLIFVGFFAVIKEYNLGWILIRGIELDNFYWRLIFILIIVFRILLFIYRKVWVIRALMRRFYRWIDAGNQNGAGPSGSVPSNGNGRRSYSTSATARTSSQRPMRLVKQDNKPPVSKLSKTLRALKISVSGKLGNFFKVITKRGALVSLTKGKGKNPKPTLSDLFNNIGYRMFNAVFVDKGKYLSRIRQLYSFLVHIDNNRRNKGAVWVVKYLKVSQLALQKSIAGTPVRSLFELEPDMRCGRTVTGGIPKWIPLRDRRLMLINHSPSIIRWYLTLFAVYRVILIPGKLKLSTITDGLTVLQGSIDRVAKEVTWLVPVASFDKSAFALTETPYKVDRTGLPVLPFFESASATMKTSWLGMVHDVQALRFTGNLNTLLKFLALTGQTHYLKLLSHMSNLLDANLPILEKLSCVGYHTNVGRLALKEEAAGKVRVFAMVTFWDQVALRPLHNMLFAFLKRINNDATFDQHASVLRCMEKASRAGKSFGYDLSAATDRLPLSLQIQILDQILPGVGIVWGKLLTDRNYFLLSNKKAYKAFEGPYRYAVGQPMGALSSWGMLAVTHHLIAQLAAHRARLHGSQDPCGFWNHEWYEGYEVLGDDIVIFDDLVASQYLLIMSELGVPINLAKSVVATNPTFEFAKVTGHYNNHVAAISWAMFMSQPTVMGRVGICFSLLRKGIVKKHIIRYITRFSRESKFVVGIPNLFYLGLASVYANSGVLRVADIVHKVITYRDGKLTLVPALFENSYGSIVRAFVSAVAHSQLPVEVISIPHRKVAFLDYSTSNLALKKALIKTIVHFVHGSKATDKPGYRVNFLQPSVDAAKLAQGMIMEIISFPTQSRQDFEAALQAEGAFTLKPLVFQSLSPLGALIHPLYCHLFFQIYTILVNKWDALTKVKTINLKGLELEALMDLIDIIDRYQEVLKLLQRKSEKEANKLPDKRNLIDSPLKILIQVLKSESRLDYMRSVVLTTGTEVLTRIFTGKDTSFYSIFDPDASPDYPDLRPHAGAPSLAGITSYVNSHGQEFVSKHLPKWGRYAAAMFEEPPTIPKFNPWNMYMAQPDYLYCIGMFDSYLGDGETLTSHYASVDLIEKPFLDETADVKAVIPKEGIESIILDVESTPR